MLIGARGHANCAATHTHTQWHTHVSMIMVLNWMYIALYIIFVASYQIREITKGPHLAVHRYADVTACLLNVTNVSGRSVSLAFCHAHHIPEPYETLTFDTTQPLFNYLRYCVRRNAVMRLCVLYSAVWVCDVWITWMYENVWVEEQDKRPRVDLYIITIQKMIDERKWTAYHL